MTVLKPKVNKIIEAILKCDLDDFMLILKMEYRLARGTSFEDNVPSGVKVLQDAESGHGDLIVFSNTDCSINGYGERWLMEPSASFWD